MAPSNVDGDDRIGGGFEDGGETGFAVTQNLLGVLPRTDVLRHDHDAAAFPMGIQPRPDRPAQPDPGSICLHPQIFIVGQGFTRQALPVNLLPPVRDIGMNLVMVESDEIAVAATKIVRPTLADGEVIHVPIEHGDGRRGLMHEGMELSLAGLQDLLGAFAFGDVNPDPPDKSATRGIPEWKLEVTPPCEFTEITWRLLNRLNHSVLNKNGQVVLPEFFGDLARPEVNIRLSTPVLEPHPEALFVSSTEIHMPPVFVLDPGDGGSVIHEGSEPLLGVAKHRLNFPAFGDVHQNMDGATRPPLIVPQGRGVCQQVAARLVVKNDAELEVLYRKTARARWAGNSSFFNSRPSLIALK